MTGWEPFLDALGKYSWRTMLGVFIGSTVMLCFSDKMGVSAWFVPFRGWFILASIVSGSIVLTHFYSTVQPKIREYEADWRMRRLGRKHLRHLSRDEKSHCQWFVDHDGNSLEGDRADGAIGSLLGQNILFAPSQQLRNGLYHFRIQPWALKYIKEHLELLK